MSRRPEGDGSVYEYTSKGVSRYRIQWMEPADPSDPDSGRKRRSKAGFKTKREALTELRAKLSAVDAGEPTTGPTTGTTLQEFLKDWIPGHRVDQATRSSYARLARLHVIPYIGTLPLTKVTPIKLASLYRQLEEGGRRNRNGELTGQGLGPNSVHKVHQMLSVALNTALEDGMIRLNPARMPGAKPPTAKQVKAAKPEIVVWTPQDLRRFLTWARQEDPDMYALWCFMLHTGVRRGEAVGLRWADIDFRQHAAHIRRSVGTIKNHGQKTVHQTKATKNTRPRRIDLDPTTVSVMREHRLDVAAKDMNRVRAQQAVFTLRDGRPLRPDHLSWRWGRAIERFNQQHPSMPLDHIPVHGIRHTHASQLFASGNSSKAVQERLGHESHTITMDLYTHLMPTTQTEAVRAFHYMLYEQPTEGENETGSHPEA